MVEGSGRRMCALPRRLQLDAGIETDIRVWAPNARMVAALNAGPLEDVGVISCWPATRPRESQLLAQPRPGHQLGAGRSDVLRLVVRQGVVAPFDVTS